MRAAAVEALASIDGAATLAALRELCDQYGRSRRPAVALRTRVARRVDPRTGPPRRCGRRSAVYCRVACAVARRAARSPGGVERKSARHAAGRTHRLACGGRLPRAGRRLAGDGQAPASAGRTIRRRRAARQRLRVRTAAIAALGQLGGRKPQDALQGLLAKHQPERLRIEAVAALAKLGRRSPCSMRRATSRGASCAKVAEALPAWPDAEAAAVARRLLDDPSGEVQRAVLAATDKWPMELAGPILLSAMGRDGFMTRKTAAAQLAVRWPPAGEFPVEGPATRCAEVLDRLQTRFRQEYPHGRSGDSVAGRRPRGPQGYGRGSRPRRAVVAATRPPRAGTGRAAARFGLGTTGLRPPTNAA